METNLPLYTWQCQNHSSVNGIYPGCPNDEWTCGFWPGEIWLAYEATGGEAFKKAALVQVGQALPTASSAKSWWTITTWAFLYSPSCVAAWKLVGSEKGRDAAIAAADQLLTRYQPSGRFLQAWGAMDDPDNYRFYHRLYAERPPAVLGYRSDRRREVPRQSPRPTPPPAWPTPSAPTAAPTTPST